MTFGIGVLCLLVLVLAWANGANDVSRGVATLAGSGVADAKRAVVWGTACTFLGGMAAVLWGAALVETFSSGFVAAEFPVSPAFVAAALFGAATWILTATWQGLPVSTTHALIGGIVGAAFALAGPSGVQTAAIAHRAFLPLLLSPFLALALSGVLMLAVQELTRRVPAWAPGCCTQDEWRRDRFRCRSGAPPAEERPRRERLWTVLHWLSAGATSFARGLNDVPKIAAFLILTVALLPDSTGGWASAANMIGAVALAMAVGGAWGGYRVLRVLAFRVTPLNAASGLTANVGTSMLVLTASPFGLPVSTTHVSTGALFGIRLAGRRKPDGYDALKLVLFGWLITFPVAALLAACCAWAVPIR